MQIPESTMDDAKAQATYPGRPFEAKNLERNSWRNWGLMAGTSLLTTIGLATAIPPLLSDHVSNIWPWVNTDLVLLTAISLVMLAFVGYLTCQQRQAVTMREEFQRLQNEASERTGRSYSRLLGLFNVSRIMGTEADLQGVFNCITKMCTESFDCQRASLMLFDKQTNDLVVRAASAHEGLANILGARQKIGKGISGWVAEHRKPILFRGSDDLGQYLGLQFEMQYVAASMVVPIVVGDELVGVLNVSSDSPDADYDEEDLRILWVFAENAGTFIRLKKHVDWIREAVRLKDECPRYEGKCLPQMEDLLAVDHEGETCQKRQHTISQD